MEDREQRNGKYEGCKILHIFENGRYLNELPSVKTSKKQKRNYNFM